MRPTPTSVVRVAGLALATAACWWTWLAWDREYQLDPASGEVSGPYQAWQVAGCVLCLAVLAWLAARRLPTVAVSVAMMVAFTSAWSVTAASVDESGMWAVGAVLVAVGTAVGSALVAALSTALSAR